MFGTILRLIQNIGNFIITMSVVHKKYYGEQNYVYNAVKNIKTVPGEWLFKYTNDSRENLELQMRYCQKYNVDYAIMGNVNEKIKIVHFAGPGKTIHDHKDDFVKEKLAMRIICCRFGDKFNNWHVKNLKHMIDNYSGLKYDEFVVVSSDLYGNWHNKLQMYDIYRDGQNLYFDLDVVIFLN